MPDNFAIRCDIRCQLGEGPLWSAGDNAIYWVDILAPALHRLSLEAGDIATWPIPEFIGWVVERRDHRGFIAGLQSGFAELELKPLRIRHIADPEPDYPGNRMNDAKVDPFGRIWAGTMDADMKKETGALYRLDTDLTISRQDRGYMVTNGPAFGAQGECLYHTDSPRRTVYRFDLSPDGAISAKRIFIEFPRGWGVPDGMTVDVDGGLWIAHWGGGRISRFTPNGELDRSIALPASQITSCAFAGEALDRLFVTSAALDRDDEEMAGMLFEVDPGVRGIAPNRFAG